MYLDWPLMKSPMYMPAFVSSSTASLSNEPTNDSSTLKLILLLLAWSSNAYRTTTPIYFKYFRSKQFSFRIVIVGNSIDAVFDIVRNSISSLQSLTEKF